MTPEAPPTTEAPQARRAPSRGRSVPLAAWATWLRAVRVHQWAKNGLILLPAFAAHLTPTPDLLWTLVRAFVSFSLLASSLYLVNDLVDLEHDRAHPTKRHRPLAAGVIRPLTAGSVAAGLGLVSLGMGLTLPRAFGWAWTSYLTIATAYSLALKRLVVVDVLVLASLYTVRVAAGAAAVTVPLSRWFLAFAVFFFGSLALLKRMVESMGARARDRTELAGRGWHVRDLPLLRGFGVGCAVGAVLVYCLYITGEDVLLLYSRPDVLWLGLAILLYWLVRVWLLANRGEVHEDPVLFALRDWLSYLVFAILVGTVWLAI